MNFDQSFAKLIGHEGDFSNHKSDPGGATRWGVTQRVARENGYSGDMREFPLFEAKLIYRASYWDACRCDELPDDLRFDVFDGAVNSGVGQSIKWLQRSVGAQDDGVIGIKTLLATRGVDSALASKRYNGHRLELMAGLSSWPAFGRGWALRIANNLKGM